MRERIFEAVKAVKEKQPLVHNITNQVVMNFTANGLYSLGALPVMAHEPREVAEMAQGADALVLNIGTLTEETLESMIIAGQAANQKGIPVVFDPVGVGATQFRSESAKQILAKVDVSFIRGNTGEISHLAGLEATMRGVDSSGHYDGRQIIKEALERLKVPIVMTGKTDYIANDDTIFKVANGTELLTKVTGAGCLLSAVVAAFLTVEDASVHAATAAVSYFTVAAERAAEKTQKVGQFQIAFLDALNETTIADLDNRLDLKQESVSLYGV